MTEKYLLKHRIHIITIFSHPRSWVKKNPVRDKLKINDIDKKNGHKILNVFFNIKQNDKLFCDDYNKDKNKHICTQIYDKSSFLYSITYVLLGGSNVCI